jgi:hypothetical protein
MSPSLLAELDVDTCELRVFLDSDGVPGAEDQLHGRQAQARPGLESLTSAMPVHSPRCLMQRPAYQRTVVERTTQA